MSRHTLTNTAWGEMTVTYGEHVLSISSRCKACHVATVQADLPLATNPFLVVAPKHRRTCRFHPTRQTAPPPTVATQLAATVQLHGLSPTVVFALVVLLVVLAFVGGWAL